MLHSSPRYSYQPISDSPQVPFCISGVFYNSQGRHCGAVPHIRSTQRVALEFSTQILCARQTQSPDLIGLAYTLPTFLAQVRLPSFNYSSHKYYTWPDLQSLTSGQLHRQFSSNSSKMTSGESMDIEGAEKQLKSLDHSEQHYFNRQVLSHYCLYIGRRSMLTYAPQL